MRSAWATRRSWISRILNDEFIQFSVPQGTIELRLKDFKAGDEHELDAPNAAVTPERVGEYRVDVSSDGDTTTVTVRSGTAEVTAAGSSFEVVAGKRATITGGSAPTYDVVEAGAPDAFDQWASGRDRQEDLASKSAQYFPADIAGADELDGYGHWAVESLCGPVWYPDGLPGWWAPYSYGSWSWVDPWGWTWIDADPWGWAPFHYGRWMFVGGAWGWCTGAYPYGAVFAPGLVVFIGGPIWGPYYGPGGGWGWFPLGWGEPYFPAYRAGPLYRERLNGTFMPAPPGTPYRNRSIAGAITTVPAGDFERGTLISHATPRVPTAELASARVIGTSPGAIPTEASLARGVGEGRLGPVPPAGLASREVVALHVPPPAHVPFSAERAEIEANQGRPLSQSDRWRLASSLPPDQLRTRPVRSAAMPLSPTAMLRPARPGLPDWRPALSAPTSRAVRVAGSPLEQSYENERLEMEARHQDEFAHTLEAPAQRSLGQQEELEHRELEQRYQTARRAGMTRMPAPAVGPHGGGHR